MKRILGILIAVMMVVTLTATMAGAAQEISVKLNDAKIDFADVKPQIINGRTMVPLRAIFEALGASVEWDDATKTVKSAKGDISISLTIGANELKKNGASVALDVPAQIIDSRTMVPVRAISEAYECEVNWDDATKTVLITTPKKEEKNEPVKTEVLRWDFDKDGELHGLNGGNVTLTVENGFLNFNNPTTADIVAYTYDMNLDASNCDELRIGIKGVSEAMGEKNAKFQLFFATTADPTMNEAKSYNEMYENYEYTDGQVFEILINLKSNKYWSDTVKMIRIDPFNALCEASIDYVAFYGDANAADSKSNESKPATSSVLTEINTLDGSVNETGLVAWSSKLSLSEDPADASNKVFRMDCEAKSRTYTYLWQKIQFIPGHVYKYSYDVKAIDTVEGKKEVAAVFAFDGKHHGTGRTEIFSDRWTHVEGFYVIPMHYEYKPGEDMFGMYSEPVAQTGVSYMIDNITLTHNPVLIGDDAEKTVILFQGDSITDNGRVKDDFWDLGNGYAVNVAGTLGTKYPGEYKFINRGVGGNQLPALASRADADIIALKPDYMSIMIGVNDVWHGYQFGKGVDAKTFEDTYSQLIEKIQKELPETKIMLIEPYVLKGTATNENYEEFRNEILERGKIVKRVAEKYNLVFIPIMSVLEKEAEGKPEGYLSGDGVHPTSAGISIIAREWLKSFEENFLK